MKEKPENRLPQDKDRHLDIPSEANRDKHINFLDAENTGNETEDSNQKDELTAERQKQWQQGIEEGKKARNSE